MSIVNRPQARLVQERELPERKDNHSSRKTDTPQHCGPRHHDVVASEIDLRNQSTYKAQVEIRRVEFIGSKLNGLKAIRKRKWVRKAAYLQQRPQGNRRMRQAGVLQKGMPKLPVSAQTKPEQNY